MSASVKLMPIRIVGAEVSVRLSNGSVVTGRLVSGVEPVPTVVVINMGAVKSMMGWKGGKSAKRSKSSSTKKRSKRL